MKELTHNQAVKRTDNDTLLAVHTLEGIVLRQNAMYGASYSMLETKEDKKNATQVVQGHGDHYYGYIKDVKRATELSIRREKILGSCRAWAAEVPDTDTWGHKMVDNPIAKGAVDIEDGEITLVEGILMKATYNEVSADSKFAAEITFTPVDEV